LCTEKNQNDVGDESWRTFDCVSLSDVFNFINDEITSKNVIKIKITVENDLSELSLVNQKKLLQKFKNKSVLIFIAAKDDSKFLIYWKSKDIKQLLSLKAYKEIFCRNDKDLCEYVADFLADLLKIGHLGE